MSGVLTAEQRASWDDRGFFRIAGFAEPGLCEAMLDRVTADRAPPGAGDRHSG